MGRSKPFSGKQKRQQQQAKKEKGKRSIYDTTPTAAPASTSARSAAEPRKLTSVFAREDDEAVRKRKLDAERSIDRVRALGACPWRSLRGRVLCRIKLCDGQVHAEDGGDGPCRILACATLLQRVAARAKSTKVHSSGFRATR